MPYTKSTWANGQVADAARLNNAETQFDKATEESLVIETALPVSAEEPEQVQTAMGPAIEFPNAVTRSIIFNRRWPWGDKGVSLEFTIAADVANAGGFRARVAYQIDGGAAVNYDTTLTPGNNTNLYRIDPGQIVAAGGIPADALLTIKVSRLGTDAADTHTGKMRLYHLRLKQV